MAKKRELFFFKTYFKEFYDAQTPKVKQKILWTLKLVEELDQIPETYFKHLTGTDGLYELRVQSGNDIFRIFCFFDRGNLIVVGHGFTKKTPKTPKNELARAAVLKAEYYASQRKPDQP
ncbi:type II toxin-antitoxin system RelE/ParE family toxin [Hymenobacter gummosus]|uniref:Type II toxin-antitoxin system RelE/ParE family toxin n=1 Tax=Hymenobacter gummosus TaxID=1776032 RepID=A0A3S0JDR6_9BACT|nr:type II toxin-antitoxin system RelE/ParE family toxin [Hymenobacter gummosus]RTQ46003.1 type II toxin-antitoxin system RelE/ParE family toxin [Hymenobacter gummosus]